MLNDGLFHLDPSVVQPAIPAVLFLIEHEKGLVADLGELGTPAGTALDGLIRLDVAHDHDFLTAADLPANGLQDLAEQGSLREFPAHKAGNIGQAHIFQGQFFGSEDAHAALPFDLVPIKAVVHFFNAPSLGLRAEKLLGSGGPAAEKNTLFRIQHGCSLVVRHAGARRIIRCRNTAFLQRLTGHTRRAVASAQYADTFTRRELLIGGLNNGQLLSIFQFDRNFEAMLVWMDEEAMDVNKQFYIKQTTHTTRARVDSIRYKVNVNTMEQSSVDHLELNEIGRVVFTTGKELFFDPYRRNKQTGSFILIDPITNNTSAVGMIIDRVDAKDMVTEDALATLNLPEMGIGEEYYEAIRKVCEELGRQGVSVKCITEKR